MTTRGRAAHGQGGIYAYETKDGRQFWRVLVTVTDATTGEVKKIHQRGLLSQREAVDFRAKCVNDAKAGKLVRPRKITLGEYADEWLPSLRVKESTRDSYTRKLNLYVRPRLGALPLQKLRSTQIDALYRDLETSGGKDGKPLAARTVLYTHTILRKMLTKAVDDGVLAVNPSDKATPPSAKEAASPEMRHGRLNNFELSSTTRRLTDFMPCSSSTRRRDFVGARRSVSSGTTSTSKTVVWLFVERSRRQLELSS